MSEENIENITKLASLFAPAFVDHYVLPNINFDEHCLINISIPKGVIRVYIYISYILNQWIMINSSDYDRKYMKIKFNSDDELPLNKTIEIPSMIIVVRVVFMKIENNKHYPQSFLR